MKQLNCWFVFVFICLIIIFTNADNAGDGSNQTNSDVKYNRTSSSPAIQRPSIIALVKDFAHYHLYFRTGEKLPDSFQCYLKDETNKTLHILESHFDYCYSPHYTLKLVSRSQVSWKPSNKPTTNAKINSTISSSGSSLNDTTNASSNTTNNTYNNSSSKLLSPPKNDLNDDENGDHRVIHQYLLLLLLLPNHPFSATYYNQIYQLSSLFPQLNIIVADAMEFADVAAKYFINQFPVMLAFETGLYKFDIHGQIASENLAGKLAGWLQSYPHSYPRVDLSQEYCHNQNRKNQHYHSNNNHHQLHWYEDEIVSKHYFFANQLQKATNSPNQYQNHFKVKQPHRKNNNNRDTLSYSSSATSTNPPSLSNTTPNTTTKNDTNQQQHTSSSILLATITTYLISWCKTIPIIIYSYTSRYTFTEIVQGCQQVLLPFLPIPILNLEPFLGTFTYHEEIEFVVYLVAALYTCLRYGYWLYHIVMTQPFLWQQHQAPVGLLNNNNNNNAPLALIQN
jgi:hypothetical protein